MLESLFERRAIETSNPANPADWLTSLWAGSTTSNTGATVTPSTAMSYGAVYACVRILAESVASLPLILYERLDQGKRRAYTYPLYRLLHDAPNPEMTRSEFWEAMIGLMVLWGNSYAEIERDNAFRVKALWPLRPDRMVVKRISGKLSYEYTINGVINYLPPERVLHIRGLGGDGLMGYSPVYMAREAIGLGLATEEYGARFFANDARPGGFLTYPGKLNKVQKDNLKESWESGHRGLTYSNRVAVLESGFGWQAVGMPNDDAEFLATRKFQITEIARWFRIPPHMLADLEKATFSNIEHQGLEFVIHTLRPWLVRIEQRINQSLLSEMEQQRYFCEHLVDALLRGDIKSRYEAYAIALQNGIKNPDEVRAMENDNPLPDGKGQVYWMPLNMAPMDQPRVQADAGQGAARTEQRTILTPGDVRAKKKAGSSANRQRIAKTYRKLVADATGRILRREEADVMRKAEKLLASGDGVGFLAWVEEFYREHPAFFAQYMRPVLDSLAEQIATDAYTEIEVEGDLNEALMAFLGDYTSAQAEQYCRSNAGQLRQVVNEAAQGEEIEAVRARLDEWKERTPDKQAMIQTVRCREAIARQVWIGAGIQRTRWVTNGDSCPYCNALRGKVVSITSGAYLDVGIEFKPEGAAAPLTVSHVVRHAPAHLGCDCGSEPDLG